MRWGDEGGGVSHAHALISNYAVLKILCYTDQEGFCFFLSGCGALTKRFVVLFLLVALFGQGLFASWARSAPVAPAAKKEEPLLEGPACDKEFLKRMKARSWAEGEREVEVAELIILRPDSMLEYTCFENQADKDALNNKFVQASLKSYLQSNFDHKFAGGLYGSGGTCAKMSQIWQFLKCKNFDENWFLTFQELLSKDPRTLPTACTGGNRKKEWTDATKLAFPQSVGKNSLGPMDTYNGALVGGDCKKSKIVPTGLEIKKANKTEKEYTCSTPGCYYDPTSKTCK